MSISREMKVLYQNLRARLEKEFPIEKEWINAALGDDLIRNNLEFRAKVAGLVAVIKFFNDLPIYVPEVEQQILDGINVASSVRNLNPMMTTLFFKIVMEHSKAIQAQLFEILKDRRDDAQQILDKSVSSLKHDKTQITKQLDSLDLKQAKNSLQACRGLIQSATNNVLEEMLAVSRKVAPSRSIAMLRSGLFGTKTFSGAVQLWSHNVDPTTSPAPNTVRSNTVPR